MAQVDPRIRNLSYSSLLTELHITIAKQFDPENFSKAQKDLIRLDVLFDIEDFPLLGQYNYWALLHRKTDVRVVTSNPAGGTAYIHRELLRPPKNLVVDHINGNCLDNRRINLRICTRGDNNKNTSQRTGKLLPKGITQRGDKFRVRISSERVLLNLGTFDTLEEAVQVYNKNAERYHGQYAKYN